MTVTKKQTSIAIFAVVFATAMIVGTLASATSITWPLQKNKVLPKAILTHKVQAVILQVDLHQDLVSLEELHSVEMADNL